MIVPCETADSTGVTGHGSDALAVFGIPDLNRAAIGADCERTALFIGSATAGKTYSASLEPTLFVQSRPVITSLISSPPEVVVVISQSLVTLLECALHR